jgi:hypothetical protein
MAKLQRKDELLQILLESLTLPLGSGSSALSTAFVVKSSVMIFRITVFKVAACAALPAKDQRAAS